MALGRLGRAAMSHARHRVAASAQFIRLIFCLLKRINYRAHTPRTMVGTRTALVVGLPARQRLVQQAQTPRRIKSPPPHRRQRGRLNTSHSASLSFQAASVDSLVEPAFEVFAGFLLGFA